MATYPVEIPSRDRWAVIQSTSETMYAPTFDDELEAFMFASFYSDRQPLDMYQETAQTGFAEQIRLFLDELAPREASVRRRGGDRILPADWKRQLDQDFDADDEECSGPHFEEYQLLEAFQTDYNAPAAQFVMDAFAAWRATRKPKHAAYDVYACGHSYATTAASGTVYHRRCSACS